MKSKYIIIEQSYSSELKKYVGYDEITTAETLRDAKLEVLKYFHTMQRRYPFEHKIKEGAKYLIYGNEMSHKVQILLNDFEPTAESYGVSVMIDESGEKIRYKRNCQPPSNQWQEIKYTTTGRPFFTMNGRREYLENYINY